jgi:hypothetical protein
LERDSSGSINPSASIDYQNEETRTSSDRDTPETFSAFPQASHILESVVSQLSSDFYDGPASLNELSISLSAVHFDGDKVREEAKRIRRSRELFFIPSQEEGQVLIKGRILSMCISFLPTNAHHRVQQYS